MNSVKQNLLGEIILFERQPVAGSQFNGLKEFIYFLKFSGMRRKINFSFSGNEMSSHQNLTIKENYILDSVPTSLIKNRDDNFALTTKALKNPHLKNLIQATECLDRKICELSKEDKKLVSIAKALLSSSEYIFLDLPDLNLESKHLKMAKQALLFESQVRQRKVLIMPENQEKWLELATHIVSKNEKKQYIQSLNTLCSNVLTGDFSKSTFQKESFQKCDSAAKGQDNIVFLPNKKKAA